MIFLDRIKIYIKSGNGGDGCMSFRREKFIPFGGPNGGNGGKGGDVYLEASRHLNTLYNLSLHPHLKAGQGNHGKGSDCTGAQGEDAVIETPLGTMVYELQSNDNAQNQKGISAIPSHEPSSCDKKTPGRLLGELLCHGERLLVAKGGQGGRGNTHFKSSTNRAPRQWERGSPGEEKTLILEMKLLADVAIVGMPNAGKSSLLARLTAARPKIANYPFTTLSPALGVCSWKGRSFVLADIPGLIEGAHHGKGLGHEFLRHVERTKILLHLVEPKDAGALAEVRSIEKELKLWNPDVLDKPRLIAVSKADLGPLAQKTWRDLSRRRKKTKFFLISAQSGEQIPKLLDAVIERLQNFSEERLLR
ncbi:MAG: GTPase ObgE [Elusimicrobiota bacterium]